MPVVFLLVAVLALAIVMVPLGLVLRFRTGTARRRVRRWLATINAAGFAFSIVTFLIVAAATSTWAPQAFTYSLLGLVVGAVLGAIGLSLTRWERTADGVYYTPNALLVLTITLVVTARILWGFVRAWHAWSAQGGDESWLAAAGVAGSLGAGATVLGYYCAYWIGIRAQVD